MEELDGVGSLSRASHMIPLTFVSLVVGRTDCVAGSTCTYIDESYSQCLLGGRGVATRAETRLPYLAGVNLAGFDFGAQVGGTVLTFEL